MLATVPNKPSAVDRVVDAIINEIISGNLHPGDRLPTEPELSQKLGVGRNSVREAIKQLQGFGILYIKRADGTFVAESYNQKMLDPMLYSVILQKNDWQDFVQLRSVMDIGTLYVALRDPAVTKIVPRLEQLIDECEREFQQQEPSVDHILDLDLTFHTEITGAINNPEISTVASYITRLTVPSRRRAVRRWIESGKSDVFLALHRDIVDVIARRDTASIVRVVEEHYINWK